MNNSKLVLGLSLIAAMTACKKHEVSPTTITIEHPTPAVTTSSVNDYFPMTVGSYWVYEIVNVDSLGVEVPQTQIDTVTITGDTILNGNTYTVAAGTWMSNAQRLWFYRDSSNYIVTNEGDVLFTDQPTTDTLDSYYIQNIGWRYQYMTSPPPSVATPICTFSSILHTKTDLWSENPTYPWGTPRSDHSYYAEGVGHVLQVFYFYSSPNYLHRRLTEYYIAP